MEKEKSSQDDLGWELLVSKSNSNRLREYTECTRREGSAAGGEGGANSPSMEEYKREMEKVLDPDIL